jgi:transcriptional regulator of acetoin/glycerol metabolism
VQQNDASEQSGITERERFIQALKKTDWNKAKAARVLGVSRRTIYRKLQDYGIEDNCS